MKSTCSPIRCHGFGSVYIHSTEGQCVGTLRADVYLSGNTASSQYKNSFSFLILETTQGIGKFIGESGLFH